MIHETQSEGRRLRNQLAIEEEKLDTVRKEQRILQVNAVKLRKEVVNSLPALEEAQLAWQAAQEAHQTKEDLASIEEANAVQAWNQSTVALASVAAVKEELDSIREETAIMNIMGLGDVVVAEKHLPLAKRKLDIVVRLLLDGAATQGFLTLSRLLMHYSPQIKERSCVGF